MKETLEAEQQLSQEDVEAKVEELRELPIIKDFLLALPDQLRERYPQMAETCPDTLPYHGKPHTDSVFQEAINLAINEGVSDPRELELLAIASAFHDAGYTESYDKHELSGAEIVEKQMKENGGYSNEEIERVKRIILSTQVDFKAGFKQQIQDPEDLLCKIIADADVNNFGKKTFLDESGKVFQELAGLGRIKNDTPNSLQSFLQGSGRMLASHKWQTLSAIGLFDEQKQENLRNIQATSNK